MFEFLQKSMQKPEVKSINDLIERNFTIYHQQGIQNYAGNSFGFVNSDYSEIIKKYFFFIQLSSSPFSH